MLLRIRRQILLFAAGAGLAAALAVSLWMPGALAQSDPFAAAPPPAPAGPAPVVVELFTSEGCSSCPPADDLLADLFSTQPVPGALILPLSLHVDYWNDLGWRDRFSSRQFTNRQYAYAQAFGSDRVYTPQMIVDGVDEFTGSDRARALRAIEAASRRRHLPVSVEVLPGEAGAGSYEVLVRVGGLETLRDRQADVVLALTEASVESDVARGENSGRRLRHVAVVRSLQRITDRLGDGPAAEFKASIPVDPAWESGAMTVVAFIQGHAGNRVLGAASAPLIP